VRFVHGLAKKVLIADSVALLADTAFGAPSELSTLGAWLGVVAYTIQIYFDFSGYSDMAIGLGMLFGFRIPENFRRPYSSLSITDFWRRWHITLSEWFRDYVYFPLGGSRVPPVLEYRNLIIVFFLTALWHGAAWTFLAWGGFHATWLLIDRITGFGIVATDRPARARRAFIVFLVMVSWVFFRAESMTDAGEVLQAMFTWKGADLGPSMIAALTLKNSIAFIAGCGVFFLPRSFIGGLWLDASSTRGARGARLATIVVTLPVSMAVVATGSFSPFLYFQF
jgi:alginate O-acetyltransferase complex protein AlgI